MSVASKLLAIFFSLQYWWLGKNEQISLIRIRFVNTIEDSFLVFSLWIILPESVTAPCHNVNKGLQEVPSDIPSNCTGVYLGWNSITHLPPGVFSHLNQCKVLNLLHNKISGIEKNTFKGMSNLQELFLSSNQISRIPDKAFTGVMFVLKLNLFGNMVSTIEEKAFRGLTNLQELNLEGNHISMIPDGAFDQLYSLQWLFLGGNKLRRLDLGLFTNIPRHFELDIYYNASDNLWDCVTMCWLRKEEDEGTIRFPHQSWSTPKCATGNWNSLDCSHQGKYKNTFLFSLELVCALVTKFSKTTFLNTSLCLRC